MGSTDRLTQDRKRRPSHGPSEVYGLPEETLAKLRQLAGPEGAGPDLRSLLVDAVDQMLASRAGEPGATPRSSSSRRRRQSRGKQAALESKAEGNGPTPGSLCSWAVLPDPVVRSIHQLLEATAPGHVRASLLQVCKGWAAQFSAALDEAPPGRSIHNRRCAWQLCARGPHLQGSAVGFGRLRALSLGLNRLPDPRLPPLLAALPHLEALDLHFPPCYQPTSTSHLRAISGLRIPSLGLHFRCPMLSPIQLNALQRLPNLHRLAFKLHRIQCSTLAVGSLTAELLSMTQLQELSLHAFLEGAEALLEGCLEPLAALPCLTSLKIRTLREPLDEPVEMSKVGDVAKLAGLRFLDVDGKTDLTPTDLAQLSCLSGLSSLAARNSSLLHACDLTSLEPLSQLEELDFSLHGDHVELAADDGETDMLLEASSWSGEPWDSNEALRALASLTMLRDLDLGNRPSLQLMWGENLWFLTRLSSLSKLNLRGCLRYIDLDAKRLSDPSYHPIAPLRHLTALQALSLEGYCGTDFEVLHKLPLLRHLCLRGCIALSDHRLESLCAALPWLSILDVADIGAESLTSAGVSAALRLLPVLWAVALPGQAITVPVVEQLQRMAELSHVMVTRPSRAKLEGVNYGHLLGDMDVRTHRATGDMVRRFLRAELPGKMREHCVFERSGYLDFADWDKWWLSEDQYYNTVSDTELSGSDTDASSSRYLDSGSSSEDGGFSSGDDDDNEGVPNFQDLMMGMLQHIPEGVMDAMLAALPPHQILSSDEDDDSSGDEGDSDEDEDDVSDDEDTDEEDEDDDHMTDEEGL